MTTATTCIDCEKRPTPKDGSRERCYLCHQRYEATQRQEAQEETERKGRQKWNDPLKIGRYERLFYWRHHLVGYTSGTTEDARIFCAPGFFYLESGPKEATLSKFGNRLMDMNLYQPTLDGKWVKHFKAMLNAGTCRPGARLTWKGD